jgi:hypothetical protein
VGRAGHPCQADAVPGAGLGYAPGTDTGGQQLQQPTLFGQAGRAEVVVPRGERGGGHARRQIVPRLVPIRSTDRHGSMMPELNHKR